MILEKGVEKKQEIEPTHKKLTIYVKSNGIRKFHHPKEIKKDIGLYTLTTQCNKTKEIQRITQAFLNNNHFL